MLILFDHGTPRGLANALSGHTVITAQSKGWDRLNNGDLLNAAEQAGVEVLVTTDRNIRHQQNLANRKIALTVLFANYACSAKSLEYCQRIAFMATETWVRVNENGRIVIPSSFRKALHIIPGEKIMLRIEDDELRITTVKRRVERAQRLLRQHVKPGTSLVDELIADRRKAARNE